MLKIAPGKDTKLHGCKCNFSGLCIRLTSPEWLANLSLLHLVAVIEQTSYLLNWGLRYFVL